MLGMQNLIELQGTSPEFDEIDIGHVIPEYNMSITLNDSGEFGSVDIQAV